MPRYNDHTGVPHTCPLIDEVISFIDNIPFESEDEEQIDDFNSECALAKQILENVRSHNGSLRDYGIAKQKELEELQSDKDYLEIRVKELEAEVESLERNVEDLQSEILDLS